jgi:hypothetical protein
MSRLGAERGAVTPTGTWHDDMTAKHSDKLARLGKLSRDRNGAVGNELPALPLALNAEFCLPIDLEATYTAACHRRRLG